MINPNQKYTIYQILNEGLLLNANGKPHKTYLGVKMALMKLGYTEPKGRGQHGKQYQIEGSDLIKINLCKKF